MLLPHQHNLLGTEFMPKTRRRRVFFRRIRNGILIFLVLFVAATAVLVIPSIAALRTVYANAELGKQDLLHAKDAADTLDFTVAKTALTDGVTHFQTAEDALGHLGIVTRLPIIKPNIEAVRDLLEGGKNAAEALREAVTVGTDLMSVFQTSANSAGAALSDLKKEKRPVSELSQADRRALLQRMTEVPGRLGSVRDALERALSAFDRVPVTPLTRGVLAAIEPQKQKLIELHDALSQDLSLLGELPQMIGYPEQKTYLFLLLNNTELRPGGGFIGTYGTVKITDGAIDSFATSDSYALDGPSEGKIHETAPEPITRYLRTPSWFMRDANWSPDFAVSSMEVERFYHLEGGSEQKIDGVIGITPTFISRILTITGPITIDGTVFNASNITDELEYQVELGFAVNGVPRAQRKDIVGQLGKALVDRLLSLSVAQLTDLAHVVQEMVDQKHIMVYFNDPTLEALANGHNWSGRMVVPQGDALAVIDANLGALKSDPLVDRTVSYSLRPDGGSWIARAQVTYAHRGRFDWKTTRYRTYTRFYVPIGSTLLKGEGMMKDDKINDPKRTPGTIDIGTDLGRSVFGGFISIEPGETRTLAVEYRVSDAVANLLRSNGYTLEVQKQLGTINPKLTLDLDFGKNVVRAVPAEDSKEWGDSRYRLSTDLQVHRTLKVDFVK